MTNKITAKVSAVATARCVGIIEHIAVAYWAFSVNKSDVGYHLNTIDENFRQLAEALGYSVEKIDQPEEQTAADFQGEPPALQSALIVRGANLQAAE